VGLLRNIGFRAYKKQFGKKIKEKKGKEIRDDSENRIFLQIKQ